MNKKTKTRLKNWRKEFVKKFARKWRLYDKECKCFESDAWYDVECFIETLLEDVIEKAFTRGYAEGFQTGNLQGQIKKPVFRASEERMALDNFRKLLGLNE